MDETISIRLASCKADLEEAIRIRTIVFVDEQKVPPELEVDGLDHDEKTDHFLIAQEGKPIGTARIIKCGKIAKIGRLAILKEQRGKGLGRKLMEFMIAYCKESGFDEITLGAQCDALGFYEKLGFAAHGPVFLDAGIKHRKMTLRL